VVRVNAVLLWSCGRAKYSQTRPVGDGLRARYQKKPVTDGCSENDFAFISSPTGSSRRGRDRPRYLTQHRGANADTASVQVA
jgi:hypothetical protein